MAELKTKPTEENPYEFLKGIEDDHKRTDCLELLALMEAITDKKPKMWGTSIVGFGNYHYKYASGREGDYFVTGFLPRKQNITIYIMPGFTRYEAVMSKIGKYKTGKSCFYIKKLDDIDRDLLQELISQSVEDMAKIYECK
ncbi:DUF1801 domain-containing protein [Acaryochloris marina]|uniref:DUF1801 domain-containing protein n=1 Tax=Acaryochloris marina TaxID=155978 RepID=UPI001BB0100D|nr:DUF1801 domain-containing protein [Acaryochloris marina]QUY45696.1 DUF1801 domain-containing protein [Acaryochloris marina S15]